MTDHKTGMLDDIGPEPAAQAPAAAAPQIESEGQEATLEAEARTEGDGKPKPSEARPDGYVTKGERDRIAAELQQERQQRALYEDRFNKVIERLFNQQEPKAGDAAPEYDLGPDPSEDPMGALEWAREQRRAEIERQRQYEQQSQKEQQAERQWQEAYTTVLTQFETAKQAEPELQGLYDGLRTSYAREFGAIDGVVAELCRPLFDCKGVARFKGGVSHSGFLLAGGWGDVLSGWCRLTLRLRGAR